MVDLRRYDSGFEALVVSSADGRDTLRILVSDGTEPPPSAYARTGDALRVLGRMHRSGSEVSLRCESGSVSVESRAESTLTVSVLSRTWHLFLGDEIRIRGLLLSPLASEGVRLFDPDLRSSVMLRGAPSVSGIVSQEALVVGVLGFDSATMSIFLEVADIVLNV